MSDMQRSLSSLSRVVETLIPKGYSKAGYHCQL